MNDYSIALFLHIVGALGLFTALGVEWTSLRYMQQAMAADQVREWLRVSKGAGRVGMASMVTLLVSGFYMMATVWGGVAWIIVALVTLVLLGVLHAFTGPRMTAIERAVTEERKLPALSLQSMLYHPLLWIVMQIRVAVILAIVFLMTVKPDLGGALFTVGAAVILGLAAALPIFGRKRVSEDTAA